MKNLLFLFITSFTLICCEKDNSSKPIEEIDKLPPATQTGANKIGCILDGKAFLPYGFNSTNCFYQYVDGEYYFFVRCQNRDKQNNLISIDLTTNGSQISENKTYQLYEHTKGNVSGVYLFNLDENFTSHTHTGELKITKLDRVNGIVSGTFWYDVEDKEGVVHQIRNGRFDFHYTN
ncbi:MAG: hypothetical protein ACI7YS_10685 [Flavobacterium sp.]